MYSVHYFSFTLIYLQSVARSEGSLCRQDVVETAPKFCTDSGMTMEGREVKLPKVTYRFKTVRDLAWLLTPRTYFLTNGNQFTYRTIHETLMGGCATDQKILENMKVYASYAFGDLTLSALDKEGKRKFMHLVCSPKSKAILGLWSLITSKLRRSDQRPLDWESVEAIILKLTEMNPHLHAAVPDMGRFQCNPHPLCRNSPRDSAFCSGEVDTAPFSGMESVVGWTDHISNTTGTGTAITLLSCVDGSPSWGTLSTVPQQGKDNIDDFWEMVRNNSFSKEYFARQNYH